MNLMEVLKDWRPDAFQLVGLALGVLLVVVVTDAIDVIRCKKKR